MVGHTDIRATGWVAYLPARLASYALLLRLDRPIGAWLLFLPGLWSILLARVDFSRTLWLLALFGLGSVLMRGAGCIVNDLWDRELDRQVTRTAGRPLASGAVSLREAIALLGLLLFLSLMILLMLAPLAQELGVASLALVALYPAAKRVTWWPQAVLGITFSWAAPMGYAAATGRLSAAAMALYAAAFFWILGYDTIYAHQDREDDALVGVRSTARLLGNRTRPFLAGCYGAMLALLVLAGSRAHLFPLYDAALIVPGLLLGRQIWQLDINNPELCLKLFKSNREVGLAIGAAILLGRL